MGSEVKVRTVTFGRKMPVERHGNAEFILTAEVNADQTVEDVMASLRKIVRNQLETIKSEDGEPQYNEEGYRQ
jgi:hypothetical protein